MRAGSRLILLLAAMAAPQIAAATAQTQDQSAIVVEGQRDRARRIDTFIRDLTPAPTGGQLARFEQPICPAVQGLAERQSSYIASRMRRVATAAGIRVAKPDCAPNVILIVTPDKAALIEKLAKHRYDYLPAAWSYSQIRSLQRDPSPVAAWQFESIVRADGTLVPQESAAGAIDGDAPAAYYVNKSFEGASRLKPLGRHAFVGAIVVVQGDALAGLTTTQLADYALMRALVRSDPKQLRTSASRTILSVMDAPMGTPVPVTLTPWDLGFLKAFYRSDKTSFANYQRSEMRELMERNLGRANE